MKIDPRTRAGFRRKMLPRLTSDLREIGQMLSVAEYKPAVDFKTEVLQSLGVSYYEPRHSLRIGFSEGGELTRHPWCLIAIVLEFHDRRQSRFRKLSLMVSLARFGSKYKVRGTVGWAWPLRVKYETGYSMAFPLSAADAKVFDGHLSQMKAVFVSVARRSMRSAA